MFDDTLDNTPHHPMPTPLPIADQPVLVAVQSGQSG